MLLTPELLNTFSSCLLLLAVLSCHRLSQVIIGNPDLKANHNITQIVEVIAEYDKYPRLRDLLKEVMTQQGAKVLIFCETKRGCDEITRSLRNDGWPALALHGDKSQKERDWVLAEFKSNRHPLMLATDVAARGLGRRLDACCMLCVMSSSCCLCWLPVPCACPACYAVAGCQGSLLQPHPRGRIWPGVERTGLRWLMFMHSVYVRNML
jgi:hypothetical protein